MDLTSVQVRRWAFIQESVVETWGEWSVGIRKSLRKNALSVASRFSMSFVMVLIVCRPLQGRQYHFNPGQSIGHGSFGPWTRVVGPSVIIGL